MYIYVFLILLIYYAIFLHNNFIDGISLFVILSSQLFSLYESNLGEK